MQRRRDFSHLNKSLLGKGELFLSEVPVRLTSERAPSFYIRGVRLIFTQAQKNNDFFLIRVLTKVEQPVFFRRSLSYTGD